MEVEKEPSKATKEADDKVDILDEDDDDDDDLEPIETLDALSSTKMAYLRDFIETLSEEKTSKETLADFSALPNLVKHQLQHEHPQVGVDLINALFRWQNEVKCTYLSNFFNQKIRKKFKKNYKIRKVQNFKKKSKKKVSSSDLNHFAREQTVLAGLRF
jgi:hypothetical protein